MINWTYIHVHMLYMERALHMCTCTHMDHGVGDRHTHTHTYTLSPLNEWVSMIIKWAHRLDSTRSSGHRDKTYTAWCAIQWWHYIISWYSRLTLCSVITWSHLPPHLDQAHIFKEYTLFLITNHTHLNVTKDLQPEEVYVSPWCNLGGQTRNDTTINWQYHRMPADTHKSVLYMCMCTFTISMYTSSYHVTCKHWSVALRVYENEITEFITKIAEIKQ